MSKIPLSIINLRTNKETAIAVGQTFINKNQIDEFYNKVNN
jgi:hypothetical protein